MSITFRPCPNGVLREAAEKYGQLAHCYSAGHEILNRIAIIDAEREKLATNIKEVHVGSFNDSNYRNTAISSDDLKRFLVGKLDDERRALIEKFNTTFIRPPPAPVPVAKPKRRVKK